MARSAEARATALFFALLFAAVPARAAFVPLFACPLPPDAVAAGPITGGLTCVTPGADARAAAVAALAYIDAQSAADDGPLKLEAVVNSASQVVAGTNWYVTFIYSNAKGVAATAQAVVYYGFGAPPAVSEYRLVPTGSVSAVRGAAAAPLSAKPAFVCKTAGETVRGAIACKTSRPPQLAVDAATFALARLNAAQAFTNGPALLVRAIQPWRVSFDAAGAARTFVTFVARTADGMAEVRARVSQPKGGARKLTSWSSTAVAEVPPLAVGSGALFNCTAGADPLAGGITCAEPGDDARTAADFAVSQANARGLVPGGPLALSGVTRYASQVVAGVNHFVEFVVKNAAALDMTLQAKVYQPLSGPLQLSALSIIPRAV